MGPLAKRHSCFAQNFFAFLHHLLLPVCNANSSAHRNRRGFPNTTRTFQVLHATLDTTAEFTRLHILSVAEISTDHRSPALRQCHSSVNNRQGFRAYCFFPLLSIWEQSVSSFKNKPPPTTNRSNLWVTTRSLDNLQKATTAIICASSTIKKNHKNHHKKTTIKKTPLLLALPYHYDGTSRSSEHQWARGAECP